MFQDEPDLVGQVLHHYKIERKISRGVMGIVYYAWDQVDNRYLAIKVLLPREADQIDLYTRNLLLERFTRERRILTSLRHQHIVPLYDIGQHNELMYFVMQYCSGGTLYRKLHETEKISLAEIFQYMTQAASALDFIHTNGIIHRDIKPQNFLLDAVGKLLLSDFGVAHIIGSTLTTSGQFWGAGAYASPEIQRFETPDPRDDIYSLGVILYEMVTRNNPRMLRKLRQNIPYEIDKVISKATAIRRIDRYSSAKAMVEDLERAIKNEHLDSEEKTDSSAQAAPASEQPSHDKRTPAWESSIGVRQNKVNRPESQIGRTSYRQAPAVNREVLFQSIPVLNRLPRLVSIFIVILSLLTLFVTIGVFANSLTHKTPPLTTIDLNFPSPVDSPTPSPAEAAKEAVQAYYMNWNSRNYQAAYQLLQVSYRQRFPFQALLADYQHTHYACVTIDNTTLLNNGSAQITVTDNAIEDAPSSQGTVVNRYRIVYIVSQEQGIWKLAPEHLTLESTHGICHP